MQIIVEEDTFVKSSSGNITGVIYFSMNKADFPEYRWSDFPIIISFNWLNEYLSFLTSNQSKSFEFLFMDGPYKISFIDVNNQLYNMKCIKNYIDCESIIFEETIQKDVFYNIFLRFCRKLLRLCNKLGYSEEYLLAIKNAIRVLKTLSIG